MKPIISIQGVSKRYSIGEKESYGSLREEVMDALAAPFRRLLKGGARREGPTVWAIKDVSFDVNEGDVVGIIGRNGAGKSTLLKILSRITEPTEGRITMRGRIASLLEVGTGFHPELTGRENIFLNGALLGMTAKEIKAKFDEIVAFSEIEKFLDTPVKRYSSGMYVRLAFAVAAHLEPEILVIDEVLAVGDAIFQKKCLGKMGEVARGGRTVLFVSHNMGAVRSLCTKGVFIEGGRIKSVGSAPEIVNKYLSEGFKNEHTVTYAVDLSRPIHVTRVCVSDGNGPSARLDMLKSFRVEIDYVVNEPVSGLMVGCNILTSQGESVIATTDCDLDRERFGVRGKGLHKTYVDIPGSILNSGTYLLVIGISIPGKYVYDRKEALNFELYDSGSFVVSGGGEQRRNSLLLLGLNWN